MALNKKQKEEEKLKDERLTKAQLILLDLLILKREGKKFNSQLFLEAFRLAFDEQFKIVQEEMLGGLLIDPLIDPLKPIRDSILKSRRQPKQSKQKKIEPLKATIGDMLKSKKE